MMLPSWVDRLPSGHEQGQFYGIDLGGTNLRVLWIKLGAEKGVVEAQEVAEWPIPTACYDTDNGMLLRWVAEQTTTVIKKHSGDDVAHIGFCFSFACEQASLGEGKLLLWTKSFRGSGLLGQDVVAALIHEFKALDVNVTVPALMNDTVATLVSLTYAEPSTKCGIILGTGTNCAYIERIENIKKLGIKSSYNTPLPGREASGRPTTMVINTEWGDLDQAGTSLPRCEEDVWVDCASANPGHGLFEKLIAGLYLGEIARRILHKLAEKTGLLGGVVDHGIGLLLAKEGALASADVAAIDQDTSEDLTVTASVLSSAFGLHQHKITHRDRIIARRVCQFVALRSARLCAAAISAIIEHSPTVDIDREVFTIAVDGSVFSKYPAYRVKLGAALEELEGRDRAGRVEMKLAEGGSVAGAAYLAAAAVYQ